MTIDERTRFTMRIPKDLRDFVNDRANDLGVTANALIIQILWDWMIRSESKKGVKNVKNKG